ncbi:FAD-dependent oxidoreductase [Streptomyces sp. NPDC087850]|uniref:FAD-dependent oxidoreductase n=1 Tax=Streptomyces sp. NPDC087850 TaxID=3365809 RepID=UPI00380DB559
MAAFCAGLHAAHGVPLLSGTGVAALLGTGAGRVRGVEPADGRVLPAEVVVVGIGVRPNTGWLAVCGLPLDDGVRCDAGGVTALPRVVALAADRPRPFTRLRRELARTPESAVRSSLPADGRSVKVV